MNLREAPRLGGTLSKNSRPQNVVYSGLLAAATALLVGAPLVKAFTIYLVIFLVYALITSINNYYDIEVDKLNDRHDNPLAYGKLTLRQVQLFCGACLVTVSCLQLVLVQPVSLILVVVGLVLGLVYSLPTISIQSRGLLATVLLASWYGIIPLLLGNAQGTTWRTLNLILLSAMQLLLLSPVLLAKDYKDRVGDAATGKRTPLVRYGKKVTATVAAVSGLMGLVIFVSIYDRQFFVQIGLSLLYSYLLYRLHVQAGAVRKLERLLLSAVMLTMLLLSLKAGLHHNY